MPKLELSIIFPKLFLKYIFPTEEKSRPLFCKILATFCMANSDSDVKIISNPEAKKIEDLDFAFTPPEKSSLFGYFFFYYFCTI